MKWATKVRVKKIRNKKGCGGNGRSIQRIPGETSMPPGAIESGHVEKLRCQKKKDNPYSDGQKSIGICKKIVL